MEPETV